MSDISLPQLSQLTSDVVNRLAQLRRQLAVWFWVDGLSRILWAVIALLAIDMVIDLVFRMDKPQRAVMLVLIAGALAWITWRRLLKPLGANISDDALALEVERRNPGLSQSMISALQFSRMEDLEGRGYSQAMVRQTVQRGATASADLNFGAVLDDREFRLNSFLLLSAGALLVALAIGSVTHPLLHIWANRNLLLGDLVWPQKTYLKIERADNGKVVFPRGEDWTQVVSVTKESEVVPENVYIDFRRARGRATQTMKHKEGSNSEEVKAQFEAIFASVIEPFEFRARGGDAYTPWVTVDLVEQPSISDLQLEVDPPKYTKLPPQPLPPGRGPYFILKGSTLHLKGTANKELVRAEIRHDGKSQKLSIAGGKKISGELPPADIAATQYVLDLEDTLHLTSRRPTSFGLRIRADREPRVRVRLIGVSGMVVPKARIPFRCIVTDDFGVTNLNVQFQWRGDDPARPEGKGEFKFDAIKPNLGKAELNLDDVLELESHNIPTGSGLTFHFASTDNDDVSGPNIGRSSDFLLRVVTEEELRTDLLRREKEQRQEFERLVKGEEDLQTDAKALEAASREAAELTPEQKDQLMQMQKKQKVYATNVNAIAERMANILIEVENNRLEEANGKLQGRLNEIIKPLRELADADMPAIVQSLDQVRRQGSLQKERAEAITATLGLEEKAVEKMKRVLSLMVKSEGYQEAVNLLYEIQKSQQDVLERTVKEQKERIQRILEGKETPKP
ncbi:hypothetical protein [Anatilimnocola floriformis]|uniref:hypothetical protein n=1 Tax=Anatilimnocola floriformis TaxID=2948575 RepID=UPI0020C5A1F7|nr:hypothetical protein [Anatilimnocola floriformis]